MSDVSFLPLFCPSLLSSLLLLSLSSLFVSVFAEVASGFGTLHLDIPVTVAI